MTDSFGRNINYLRVSLTDRCNLRCRYCMPEKGIDKKSHRDILSLEDIYEIIRTAVEMGFSKVRLTGGEPLVRKGVVRALPQHKRAFRSEGFCHDHQRPAAAGDGKGA